MAEQEQVVVDGKEVKPEAPVGEDVLWKEAQKARGASTQADDAGAIQAAGDQQGGGDDAGAGDDALDGLPEPTRKLIQQIQAKTAQQDAELKAVGQKLATAHGTIGNLTQRLNASLAELKTIKPTVDSVQAAEKAKADAEAAEKEAARKARRERMSDLPDVLEEIEDLERRVADVKPAVKPETEQPKPDAQQPDAAAKLAATEARIAAIEAIEGVRPGGYSDISSDAFKEWRKAQPADVQTLCNSDDVADVSKVIDLFRKHKEDAAQVAKVEADRQARLRRGENVQGSSSGGGAPDDLWEKAKRDRAKARAA